MIDYINQNYKINREVSGGIYCKVKRGRLYLKDLKITKEQLDKVIEDYNKDVVNESKYYTPSIEEFYIGFEFERRKDLLDSSSEWVEDRLTLNNFGLDEIQRGITQKYIRVKYLEEIDIEILGFKFVNFHKGFEEDYFEYSNKDSDYIAWNPKHKKIYSKGLPFSGIRNKSELKKLLKQLNINYENN